MNLITKANQEFKHLQAHTPDALALEFKDEILALIEKVAKSGQSGGSAPFVAEVVSSVVRNLCLHEPITPLTGNNDEFIKSECGVYQNKRCSSVFKDTLKGKSRFNDGLIFKEPDEFCFTGNAYKDSSLTETVSSSQEIDYPFTPKKIYIDVIKLEIRQEDLKGLNLNHYEQDGRFYVDYIKDITQLEEGLAYFKPKN